MEAKDATQEAVEIIDLTLLCEHCPFAQLMDGGAEQKQVQDERQMSLPLATELDTAMTPENEVSDLQTQRDETVQNYVIHYLMQEHFQLENDAETAPQTEEDSEQKGDGPKHTIARLSECIISHFSEGDISAQETAPSDAEKQRASDAKNEASSVELRTYQTERATPKQRPAQNRERRTPGQGRDAER